MPVSDVRRSVALSSKFEDAQQLAGPAQRARCVGPWVLDPQAVLLENYVVRADWYVDVPLSEQVSHIEVEAFADDLEDEPSSFAEVRELAERLVDHGLAVDELQQLLFARANQRELTNHRLSRSDFPFPVQLLDFPPLRRREPIEDRLGHVGPGDRSVEIG